MKLISHCLTPEYLLSGIRSLIGFGKLCGPLAHSVLYPHESKSRLALKLFRGEPAISEFDWNFSAIHSSSPHFSTYVWFGPPQCFTTASSCPWIGHPVSGLLHATLRPLQTRFRFGSDALHLNLAAHSNSPARSTKSTRSLSLPLLVNIGFQVLFHSPPGVLFTFPSRYLFAIGHLQYLALGGGPPAFPPDSSCPVVLRIPARSYTFRLSGLLPSLAALSNAILLYVLRFLQVLTP